MRREYEYSKRIKEAKAHKLKIDSGEGPKVPEGTETTIDLARLAVFETLEDLGIDPFHLTPDQKYLAILLEDVLNHRAEENPLVDPKE
jgi:hypothetical protein